MKISYINDFKEALKKEGLKFTNQRYLIFKYLVDNEGHFECDTIIDDLKNKQKNSISRATAYRTLDMLVEYNFAKKIILDDGIARYENNLEDKHHDHMICIETGKIIEFECDEIENLQEEIAKKKGYEIVKHIHQLFVKPIKK